MAEEFSKSWFAELDSKLRSMGMDSDDKSFDEIKENLMRRQILTADEFASTVTYVILASGFKQMTAKRFHKILMEKLRNNPSVQGLLDVFNNKNKINAIVRIWENRDDFRDAYYSCDNLDDRVRYLETLPHIGKITAQHLARNLGENLVKYDIWIQRLGAKYSGNPELAKKVNNANLHADVKRACDDMFTRLEQETGLMRGYIDVVLFKACQNGLIEGLPK